MALGIDILRSGPNQEQWTYIADQWLMGFYTPAPVPVPVPTFTIR